MGKFIDLTGEVFGRLTVLGVDSRDGRGKILWKCRCECGNEINAYSYNLKGDHTKSCGCYKEQVLAEVSVTHGMYGTPQYKSYVCAKDRTTNPNNPAWANYGGRGIEMCDEWKVGFEAFWEDMGSSYKEGLSIEREDTDGNYCPENCKWATESQQNHNRRKRSGCSSQYKGVSKGKTNTKFQAEILAMGKRKRLGRFTDELDAAIAYDNASEELYGDRPNKTIRKGEINA